MLSSKEIREYSIEKAVFGGYDTKGVDTLLDQVADDMEALEKENAELRAKLKVLVGKIEEYRRVESGIRQALMTAQTVAEQTKQKAKEEADETLSKAKAQAEQMKTDASVQCETIIRQYQLQTTQEQARYRRVKRECDVFIEKMTRAFREQSDRIAAIPEQNDMEFTSISGQTVRSETIESHIERPAEPEVPAREQQRVSGTEISADILEVFANASQAMKNKGVDETHFTVEVSGSPKTGI